MRCLRNKQTAVTTEIKSKVQQTFERTSFLFKNGETDEAKRKKINKDSKSSFSMVLHQESVEMPTEKKTQEFDQFSGATLKMPAIGRTKPVEVDSCLLEEAAISLSCFSRPARFS